jgi:nitrous oxidase accessory protein NosD
MKALTLTIAAMALLALGATQALARPSQAAKTVTIVMHDPGCHWFSVGSAYKTTLSVKGPIELRNLDEATLKVAGHGGTKLDRVGKQLALGRGVYHITMVGQAPDDNHLKLVVT